MKKIYLTIAAALIGLAPMSARELVFYLGDTAIEDGATVEFKDIETYPVGGGATQVEMTPSLYLYSDIYTNSVQLTAKCTSGQTVGLCAGGNCVRNTEITKTVTLQTDQMLPLQFDYETTLASGESAPEVVTEFEAVDTRHTETLKKFTFVMNPSAGVATIIADNSSFRAIAGGIAYDFAQPTAVALYSITGQKVLATTLNGSGTLSTSSLPSGLYVYTLAGKSSKIYLR